MRASKFDVVGNKEHRKNKTLISYAAYSACLHTFAQLIYFVLLLRLHAIRKPIPVIVVQNVAVGRYRIRNYLFFIYEY